jgi:agmatinase
MDAIEKTFMEEEKTFFAHDMVNDEYWIDKVVEACTDTIFITFDLDVLDPSIMPSTGTPEPGGLLWYETLEFLKQVFAEKNVVGFDIVELCPKETDKSSDFLAAKLYYKMLSYKFMGQNADEDYDNSYDVDYKSNTNSKFEDDEE